MYMYHLRFWHTILFHIYIEIYMYIKKKKTLDL